MLLLKESKYEVKKSKFLSFLYELDSFEQIDSIIDDFKKNHKKSDHICYAGIYDSEIIFKNDSEVGNPGKVLLNLLQHNNKKRHLIVVVRYFGGIKLGVGGVQRGFRNCAKECFE